MGTWTRFYINISDTEKVNEILMDISNIKSSVKGNVPDDFNDSFILNEKSKPNYLVFGEVQKNWITVLYNSANKLNDWSEKISKDLNCNVIVTIGQNTVDYYYFSQYHSGIKEREIEVCYGDDIEPINFGTPYEFEENEPGERQDYDGEISYLFDFDSIEKYAQHFGLEPQNDWGNVIWTILKGEQNQESMADLIQNYIPQNKKPWWKFW
ncbi:MAG: hypothetical protein GQ574_16165 [Crocinitomix sp.]|nr:hypothetical protein [Crocinitomix sp.]